MKKSIKILYLVCLLICFSVMGVGCTSEEDKSTTETVENSDENNSEEASEAGTSESIDEMGEIDLE